MNVPINAFASLEALLDVYWDEPVAFCEDILQVQPDPWQCEVLNDLAHNRFVSVRSGQGVGKTGLESWAVLWYLCTRPFPKVVCTAPTMNQLFDVLWAEISKWLSNSLVDKLLEWTKTKIYMRGQRERWFATAKTATKPENMQGYHEDFMLFIVDEASGVEDKILEAILGTLSGPENKLLMCGNPNKTSGIFYDSHNRDRKRYKVHKVSSMDSSRTSKENIEMLLEKYGPDSDVARVRIFGDFPRGESDAFIALEIAEQAKETRLEIRKEIDVLHLGVDVARFGDDETIIAPRIDNKAFPLHRYRKQGTTETTGLVIQKAKELMKEFKQIQRVKIKVDDSGIGGGVTDQLNEIIWQEGLPFEVYGVINNGKADDDHYDNLGTEMWGTIRTLLEENMKAFLNGGEPVIELPDDEKLITQLSTRRFKITSRGRIILERKEDMKKRGLDSPDRADAVALAFHDPSIQVFV
jgi:phage terminase large subunit